MLIPFTFAIVNAQIQITSMPSVTPEEMVEKIVGEGIQYSNVQFTGAPASSGIFSNGETTNLGMNSGSFLTTGAGDIIPGPNNNCSAGIDNGFNPPPWPIWQTTYFNPAQLEFDFIPESDTITIKYVFGSEEYNDWVGSVYNDEFGIFISGPNPTGGNYSDKNIALIPGTNTSVKINSVNNGYATCGSIPTGPCTYCEYYNDNTDGTTLQYDGFTLVLTAFAIVIPFESYHVEFMIADCGDAFLDSGIFIGEDSFMSPVATGQNDLKKEMVTVSPNPSGGKFWIQGNYSGLAEISVSDFSGSIIYSDKISADNTVIDLTGRPKGLYLLQIKSGSLNLNRKLIIR